MIDFPTFMGAALSVALLSLPLVFTACAFLDAARTPQWVWVMSNRTQIWWLAGLAVGIPVVPIGIPAAIWYFWKIRPKLSRIESGRLD